MKVLWVATKAPWPVRDGGRLLMHETLLALRARGHDVTLVAPVDPRREDRAAAADVLSEICTPHLVPARERPLLRAALWGLPRGLPASVARHRKAAVSRRVSWLLRSERFDVVHAEQLQALANCRAAAASARVPLVLRAQNVESQLWLGFDRGMLGPLARLEAGRLRRFEGRAVARARLTVALTAQDARSLAELASSDQPAVTVVRAPFPARLPVADVPLTGDPAVVLLTGRGWAPNSDGAAWFEREVWPAVRSSCPRARLHHFGGHRAAAVDGVVVHDPPADSREVFGSGTILVVPLHVASGVRMKILESWARGVPVVATAAAAAGLEARAGRELLIASSAEDFARSLCRLAESDELQNELVRHGRELLARRHDPDAVAARLEACYEAACERAPLPPPDW